LECRPGAEFDVGVLIVDVNYGAHAVHFDECYGGNDLGRVVAVIEEGTSGIEHFDIAHCEGNAIIRLESVNIAVFCEVESY